MKLLNKETKKYGYDNVAKMNYPRNENRMSLLNILNKIKKCQNLNKLMSKKRSLLR